MRGFFIMKNLQTYNGNDLGAVYSKQGTSFRLWAPTASDVTLNLYKNGDGDCLIESVPMSKDVDGTWLYEKKMDILDYINL